MPRLYANLVYGKNVFKKISEYVRTNFKAIKVKGQVEKLPKPLIDFHFIVPRKLTKNQINAYRIFLEHELQLRVAEIEDIGEVMSQKRERKLSAYNQFVSDFALKKRKAGKPFRLVEAAEAWQKMKSK